MLLFGAVLTSSAAPINEAMTSEQATSLERKIKERLTAYPLMFDQWRSQSERRVKLMQVRVRPRNERVELYFNDILAQITIREPLVKQWEQMICDTLSEAFKEDYDGITFALYSRSMPIERFIPNAYRKNIARDEKRTAVPVKSVPLVSYTDRQIFEKGLKGAHIALWPSHGAYYDAKDSVWQWQRPALFGYIEDLHSYEYCYRYLMPMLENAGAVVVSPRERAIQEMEVVVKDNISRPSPFSKTYQPKVPGRGVYGISVRYNASSNAANNVSYRIYHLGGISEVRVNQRMGGGMWIYLGEFDVDQTLKVELCATGEGVVSSTGVRVGGGMGDIERGGSVSGAPRWAEAARYSMQYNGVPESIYAQQSIEDKEDRDYVDDYKSRGDWVNWLRGAQHIPVDMALAFHTNAGINDSIFGSLTIHYTNKGRGVYGNGKSRFAGRDLADMLLTQIVDDIQAKYTRQWTRRSIYDKSYAEISRPDVPSAIVELFSHQNQRDVELATTPQFRFDAARSIYKGALKFLADRYNRPYVVQPLPVTDFAMSVDTALHLQWRRQIDSLEPTARATHFRLYTRVGNGAFDGGVDILDSIATIAIARDSVQRSYRITAVNAGGESFSSPVLSCGFISADRPVVTVKNECRSLCAEVPYIHDLGYVGEQYDFDPLSQFMDNANPGFGASKSDKATVGREGETFDNTLAPGAAQLAAGNSYISSCEL